MTSQMQAALNALDGQRDALVRRLTEWCAINSGTDHTVGLARMAKTLEQVFSPLADRADSVELAPPEQIDHRGQKHPRPLGRLLRFSKRPAASRRVLLAIHYDTVYGLADPFQSARLVDGNLNGPGAADAKGGILVMLSALTVLESSGMPADFGWDVLLNPDEEIGSPGSGKHFAEAAKKCGLALLFEPSQADGSLVSSRKGSGNFTVIVRGRSAHAGRDFEMGRSAIVALARLIDAIDAESRKLAAGGAGITINCGRIDGGTAANVVPDLAVATFNARALAAGEDRMVVELLERAVARTNQQDGIRAELHGEFSSPPKPLDERSGKLLEAIRDCGRDLGVEIAWKPSGGACDGNRLAALGLPVVDSLGPIGGRLHSDQEYAVADSLVGRIKLTALLLMRLADPAYFRGIAAGI